MKKIRISALTSAVMLCCCALLVLNSCKKDPCEDVTCANGTLVESGDDCNCSCDDYYEGASCADLERAKMLSSYTVTESCSGSGSDTYQVTVSSSSSDLNKILISNFWNVFTNSVVATVDGNDITIDNQQPDNDGFSVQGNGDYNTSNGNITMSYTIVDNNVPSSGTASCTATLVKL